MEDWPSLNTELFLRLCMREEVRGVVRASRCNLAVGSPANHVTSLGLTFIICERQVLIQMPYEILEPTLAQTEGSEILPTTLHMPKWEKGAHAVSGQ